MSEPSNDASDSRVRRRNRAPLAAALAASLEWYDFFIYGTAAALVFNRTFFATGDPVISALNSFATFAVGFVVRPVGGVIAGHFGDRVGRKPVLVAAIVAMAVATALIGVTPDTEIGWLAPVFLTVLRIAQGLAIGAQWGGAMLLATEHAPPGRRGFYGSFAQIGAPVGVLAGNLIFLLSSQAVSRSEFLAWAWRIPFLASILLLAVGLYIHRHLEETPEFREIERKLKNAPRRSSPVLQVLRHNGGTVALAAGAFVVVHATFYATITGSLQLATVVLGLDSGAVLTPVLCGAALMVVLMPLSALASDLYGRIRVYGIGLVVMAVSAAASWWWFGHANPDSTAPVWVVVLASSVAVSLTYGPQAALFNEIFPAELRYSGASLGYQISGVFGGLTPMIMVALVDGTAANTWRFGTYLVGLSIVALVCLKLIGRGVAGRDAPARRRENAALRANG